MNSSQYQSSPSDSRIRSINSSSKKLKNCLFSWKNYIHPDVGKAYSELKKQKSEIMRFSKRKDSEEQINRMNRSYHQQCVEREDNFEYSHEKPPTQRKLFKTEESRISTYVESVQQRGSKYQLNINTLDVVPLTETQGQKYREEERLYLLNSFIDHLNREHGANI